MKFLDVIRTKSQTWTFAPIPPANTPDKLTHDPIEPNEYYMSVTLRSFRIPDVRFLGSKFYGTVQSCCSLQTSAGVLATLQAVVSPDKLKGVDPNHVDRTIVQDIPLLGPVPFTGGNFTIEIGLFAMKESDLTQPYLDLLGTVAGKAGIAYFSQAMEFVGPIADGINGIVDSAVGGLQIGLYKGFVLPDKPMQGYYAVIELPAAQVNVGNLIVDSQMSLIDPRTNREFENAYLVFTLERLTTRSDWRQIPDVKDSYDDIRTAEKTKDKGKITAALATFNLSVLGCTDLLDSDQSTIINVVESEVNRFLTELATVPNPTPLAELDTLSIQSKTATA